MYLNTLPRGAEFKVSDYAGFYINHAPLYNAELLAVQTKYRQCLL
jgi:hypothetical protein